MEALILYLVLFFPGVYFSGFSAESAEVIPFFTVRELGRLLTYTLPSLALLFYMISGRKGFPALKPQKPGKDDFLAFSIGLPGLFLIGFVISVLVSLLSKPVGWNPPPHLEAPVNAAGWVIVAFSCLGTGYLEESYFRYYLLAKFENTMPHTEMRVIFSTFLFSLCHIYEGPWGAFNAVLASILLSALFIRYKSLHGIAWAHGFYNILVYLMGHHMTQT
jgi:membrane protease YdiL (CAAX protease family)